MTVIAARIFPHARSPNRERPHHTRRSGNTGAAEALHFIKAARERGDDGMEILMIDPRRRLERLGEQLGKQLGLAAILSAAMMTASFARTAVQEPNAYASNETATRPWSAPVGHRQPRAADIPATTSASHQIIDQEDVIRDRKIKGICRGC
ncbi:hypothetical protein [Bradyrhizobium sp. USDA 3364]